MKPALKFAMLGIALAALLASPVSARGQAAIGEKVATAVNQSDQKTVVAIAQANRAEVEAGKPFQSEMVIAGITSHQ